MGVPVSTRISYEKLRDEAGRDGTIVAWALGKIWGARSLWDDQMGFLMTGSGIFWI